MRSVSSSSTNSKYHKNSERNSQRRRINPAKSKTGIASKERLNKSTDQSLLAKSQKNNVDERQSIGKAFI